jgi:hypothetical protein
VIRFPSNLLAALALVLALAGCKDARREIARDYLQTHPPEGFAVVAVPETIPVMAAPDGSGDVLVSVRYRLVNSTIEVHDGFTLPRGQKIAAELTAIRGWALSSLPDGQPVRDKILTAVAQARAPMPVKRVVTPAGTELDAVASLKLRPDGATWRVAEFHVDASVPGAPDSDPRIPAEDSPAVSTRFDQLASTVKSLDDTRRDYLAARERTAAASLAKLRAELRTNQSFEGELPDRTAIRVVVSKGLEGSDPAVAVLTRATTDGEFSDRFTGSLVQQPTGEMLWRAANVVPLSSPPATGPGARPTLTLFSTQNGLEGRLEIGRRSPIPLTLRPAGPVDLIPDVPPAPPATP